MKSRPQASLRRFRYHLLSAFGLAIVYFLLIHENKLQQSSPMKSTVVKSDSLDLEEPLVFHMVFTTGPESLSTLNLRSIESVFYHHKTAMLRLYTRWSALPTSLQELVDAGYQIQLVSLNAEDIIENTLSYHSIQEHIDDAALKAWAKNLSRWRAEPYWYSNESNLLRICLLLTIGGVYLDTDVILVNSLIDLPDNSMSGREGGNFICSAMIFRKPGNLFLAASLNNFVQYYNGRDWGNNGPRVFRRTSVSHSHLICSDANSAMCWLKPLPNSVFQPVHYKSWAKVCLSENCPVDDDAKQLLRSSRGVHMNNQVTGTFVADQIYVSNSLCDQLMKNYCVLCL